MPEKKNTNGSYTIDNPKFIMATYTGSCQIKIWTSSLLKRIVSDWNNLPEESCDSTKLAVLTACMVTREKNNCHADRREVFYISKQVCWLQPSKMFKCLYPGYLSTVTMIMMKRNPKQDRERKKKVHTNLHHFYVLWNSQSTSLIQQNKHRSDCSTEFWNVEARRFKEQRTLNLLGRLVCFVQQFEDASAKIHWNAHDDALTHTCNKQEVKTIRWLTVKTGRKKSFMFNSTVHANVCYHFWKSNVTKSRMVGPLVQEHPNNQVKGVLKRYDPLWGWSVTRVSIVSFAFYPDFVALH